MSYSLIVTHKYQAAFASLPIWLQEETLDETELLLTAGAQIRHRPGEPYVIRDFTRLVGGRIYYVFLTIAADHAAEELTMVDVGYWCR